MKKTITVEQSFCDVCGQESSGYTTCDSCGKDFCYECKKTEAIEYAHAVFFSGSGDGLYCIDCDAKLRQNGDKKHAAYRAIQSLRHENKAWSEDFKKRAENAMDRLKALEV